MDKNKTKIFQLRIKEDELKEARELAKIDYEGNLSMLIRNLLKKYKREVEDNEI